MKIQDDEEKMYGDSKFLAMRDTAIKNFRGSEKHTNHKIIEKMLTLRHNMKYNKHLVSVYMKAKELFDQMLEEHRAQLDSLDEIYRHLNTLIRENLSNQRIQKKKNGASDQMMAELVKDKKRIGSLLKKMKESYEKLMNVDTVIGVTVNKINEITFMDDHDNNKLTDSEDDDEDVEDYDDDDDDDNKNEIDQDYEDDEDDEDDDEDDEEDDEDEDDEDEYDEDDEEEDQEDDEDEYDEEEDEEVEEDDEDEEDEEEDDDNEDDEDEEAGDEGDKGDEEYEDGNNNQRAILVF
jgi:hypothetical protein